jgi:hypothetical protein
MNHYEGDVFQGFCCVGRTFLTNVNSFVVACVTYV